MANESLTHGTDKERRCSLLDSGKGNQYRIDQLYGQTAHLSSVYSRRRYIKDKRS